MTKRAGVWMYKNSLGQWKPFLTERHRQDTIDSGGWEVREFFSHASPVDAAVHPMTNETGRAGLLPCPFCGGEAEFKPYKKDGLTIKCKSFGCVRRDQRVLRQSIDWLREAMAKDWNTRTNPPPVDAADDEESICQFTPGHSEFESRQVFAPSAVPLIVRGCCESEPADPDSPDTICINALDLEGIVASHLGAVILRDDPIPQVRQSPGDAAVERDAPDPTLLKFYQVDDYPALVAEMEGHILKLIDTHKRNVKPWEDTFPPTLLPKWIRKQEQRALVLADSWQDEAAESWGESREHATLQRCADELRAALTAQQQESGS